MADFTLIEPLTKKTDSKIFFLVIDGVGDLPDPDFNNKTPLEAARIPNLDRLASEGSCGVSIPVKPGITPGSGPAHLSLFGYNPVEYDVGRGVLSALGIGIELTEIDVAARVNFCNVDKNGIITDRRAGRISTEICAERCRQLSGMKIDGAEISINPEKEHRASLVIRGDGLGGKVSDTDPQETGKPPLIPTGDDPASKKTAEILKKFLVEIKKRIGSEERANMILMRGFDEYRKFPSMQEIYKLTPACIASYPMYKGVTRLIGMQVLDTGDTIAGEFNTLKKNYDDFDFFYLHFKKTDSAGEDGNFSRKKEVLEELDNELKILDELKFDVIVVCGDHSTPCIMKAHSWHPVPFIIKSKLLRSDEVKSFSESECRKGDIGLIEAVDIMPIVLSAAGKLIKYGA